MARPRTSIAIAAVSILALVGACSDQPMAPSSTVRPPNPDVIIDNVVTDGQNMDVDFTVTSTGGWYLVGPHKLYFPANSICDPARSTYGITEWDKPCVVATEPVKIHASVRYNLLTGKPSVDFTPSLRFAPSTDSSNWVWLFFYSEDAKTPMSSYDIQRMYNILWAPMLGAAAVDESLTDATLKTGVMSQYGLVYRRIKHFSGYQVGSGIGYGEEGM
jgi:hypothetical protein